MLRKAKERGIVAHYGDMYEHFRDATDPAQLPLFSGDYWVDALARHAAHVERSEFKGGKRTAAEACGAASKAEPPPGKATPHTPRPGTPNAKGGLGGGLGGGGGG